MGLKDKPFAPYPRHRKGGGKNYSGKDKIMNMLNQIIIEGTVTKESVMKEGEGKPFLSIPVASKRYCRDERGEISEEVTFFDVRVWGEAFCRISEQNATKGRGIRVVGRLAQETGINGGKKTSRLYIVAEHIDYKPKDTEEKAS